MEYYELPGFENVYLEDSYVLGFEEEQGSIKILLDLVLTESHPLYSNLLPGERFFYKKSHIAFNSVKLSTWSNKVLREYKDANEEIDYGNVDRFFFSNDHYCIEGDWGKLDIVSSPPILTILDESNP